MLFNSSLLVAIFAALTAAVPGPAFRRQNATSTSRVATGAHPLTMVPLSTLAATATPLVYGIPPSPSKLPGHPFSAGDEKIETCTEATSAPITSSPVTSTLPVGAICTTITGDYPRSTVPGFCRPSIFVNAPKLRPITASNANAAAAVPTPVYTATVTMGANTVPDKIQCCSYCADYYNCYAWQFVPSHMDDKPTDRLPGGFDPFRSGNCLIAYYVGNGTRDDNTFDNASDRCPNGRLLDVLEGTNNRVQGTWNDGMYFNGWNQGACGDAGDTVFSAGEDIGFDWDSLCHHA
ncbi:hypothetical protein GGR57DRAFT_510498 [Xylariaceae sp. FL1272]|nr:hypothetical protein GGR57DRAFT_510498 [Xylariaceae sp. FL1272]